MGDVCHDKCVCVACVMTSVCAQHECLVCVVTRDTRERVRKSTLRACVCVCACACACSCARARASDEDIHDQNNEKETNRQPGRQTNKDGKKKEKKVCVWMRERERERENNNNKRQESRCFRLFIRKMMSTTTTKLKTKNTFHAFISIYNQIT